MDKLTGDLWDSKEKKFNQSNMQILLNHITGKPNATMGDIEALFGGKPIYTNATTLEASGEGDPNGTYYQEYSSKVVKSNLLNQNANKITPGIGDNHKKKGLCVTLKGKVFRVTSLTRTVSTDDNPNGDIVATLLLKEPEGKKWGENWNVKTDSPGSSSKPSNMYGASDIRKTLIGTGGWLDVFIGGDYDFAKSYLVQPKQIGYQHEQSVVKRWKKHGRYSLPNEALGNVGGFYQGYDYYNNGDEEKRAKYISWGEDYVWLPSLSEIIGIENGVGGIWGMLTHHAGWCDSLRKFWQEKSKYRYAWLRTGDAANYKNAYRLSPSGGEGPSDHDRVASNHGLRPALHFNLSNANRTSNLVRKDEGGTATDTEINRELKETFVDLWDSEERKFDKNKIQILIDHITGKPNADMGDVEALFSGDPIYINATKKKASGEGNPNGTYYQEYSSKVVKSDLLNRNANKITPGIGDDDVAKGLCVTLKGKVFRVTSLTKTMTTDKNSSGDLIATLLLKEPEGVVEWNACVDDDSLSPEPSNMYGASDIRRALIGTGGWQESFIGSDIDFANKFLVQPNFIGYQHMQSFATRWKSDCDFSLPNEALGNVKGYHKGKDEVGKFENYDYYNNGNSDKRNKYILWGNDYVWLPSLTEIGTDYWDNESKINDVSIWGMSTSHRGWQDDSEDENESMWLRSGYENGYYDAYILYSFGADDNADLTLSHGLRPALHLNLSAVMKLI